MIQDKIQKKTTLACKDFISTVAQKNPNLVTAYLFGSYAKGEQKDDSDIDLALIIDHLKDNEKFDIQVQLCYWHHSLIQELNPIHYKEKILIQAIHSLQKLNGQV